MALPEALLKAWSSTGRNEALAMMKKAYYRSRPSVAGDIDNDFTRMLYDLFHSSLTDVLDPEDAGEFCATLVSSLDSSSVLSSLMADILTTLDAEVACNEKKSQRMAFKTLVRSLVGIVGEDVLKERLDMDTLELAGLIPSKNNYNQKYVKTKTKLFYKQQKFNLFREESEGYSKLVCELGHERLTGVDPNKVLESIKSLIGRFSLDPNRALDVILEAFELHLEDKSFFVSLLNLYPCDKSTFVNILGFKFHSYQGMDNSDQSSALCSLYQMTSVLLQEKLVDLDSLYPHLTISEEELEEVNSIVMDDARTIMRKANVVSLMEKTDEEKEKESEALQLKKDRVNRLLSTDVNQKLGLCHACLLQGNWESASLLMQRMPCFLPVWSTPVVEALCTLVNHTVEPLYRHISPRGTKSSFVSSLKSVQCRHSFDDMLDLKVFDMLYALGPSLHNNPLLLCKIVRIGKAYFKDTFSHCSPGDSSGGLKHELLQKELFRCFLSVLDGVVLPSLSMLQCNCGIAEEVWSMMRLLPYETRYMLYGYWKNNNYEQHPDLMKTKAATIIKGRYIMKRLTKDNVKPSGRQIGKLSHNNPGIIFDYVLSQIQKYDNIIIPVVDSLKYLTPIAYDVLAYCVIKALGNPLKERMKHEDTNLSSWLQGLANFCANVFKKYPIELTGLLQYITNQLKAGKSFDLLVLKEVIQKMAGIEISDEVTASQLEAMAGGELLKVEGGYFSQVRNTKKSSQRLREALVDSNLCLPLFILTAQQRDCILFRDGSNMHLKLVGSMYDHCMDTLVQFGGFLSSHLSPEEYSRRVINLDVLIKEYRLPGDIAFFLYRPKLSSSIGVKFAELEKVYKSSGEKSDRKSVMGRQEKHFSTACDEVLSPIVEAVKPLQLPKVWEDMNCKLYVVFWSLTLYDLHVPKERYDEEINKAKDVITALENNQEMPSSKKKKEQERSEALISRLQEEKKRQEDNHQLILGWLRQEKDSWFNPKVTKNRTLTQFLQLCIFPRCCFTTTDAVYCAKFIQTLHSLETPQFSTLLFLDRVFSDLSYTVSCCTENEVRRYGHFLSQLLGMVSRWHSTESCYNTECANTPGFISMMRSSGTNERQFLDFDNYRHITFKWHFKLTKSLVICLESKEYIQIRNGLVMLTKVLPHYPKVHHLSLALEKRVEKIMEEEKEKRPDLYILAIGYAGMLKAQKSNLIAEQDFHKKSDNETKPTMSSNPKTSTLKVEKKEEIRSKDTSSSNATASSEAVSSTNSMAANNKEDKIKSLKEESTAKSPLRVSTSQKMELKLKKVDKDERFGLSSPVSNSVATTTPSSGSEESKKSKTITSGQPAGVDRTTASSASRSTTTADGRSTISPAKTGQRRPHSTAEPQDSSSEKEPKRRKTDDSSKSSATSEDTDKRSSPSENKEPKEGSTLKTERKKVSNNSSHAVAKDSVVKEVTTVKVDRKRERPQEKEEGSKKRRESVEAHNPPSATATANNNNSTTPSNTQQTTNMAPENKEKKRVVKVAKLDKTDNVKKRTKSPVNEKEPSKRHTGKQGIKK